MSVIGAALRYVHHNACHFSTSSKVVIAFLPDYFYVQSAGVSVIPWSPGIYCGKASESEDITQRRGVVLHESMVTRLEWYFVSTCQCAKDVYVCVQCT